jgi:hypothetical protein
MYQIQTSGSLSLGASRLPGKEALRGIADRGIETSASRICVKMNTRGITLSLLSISLVWLSVVQAIKWVRRVIPCPYKAHRVSEAVAGVGAKPRKILGGSFPRRVSGGGFPPKSRIPKLCLRFGAPTLDCLQLALGCRIRGI